MRWEEKVLGRVWVVRVVTLGLGWSEVGWREEWSGGGGGGWAGGSRGGLREEVTGAM